MRRNKSLRPSTRPGLRLETLEDRLVPATVLFSGGNLTVSAPTHLVGTQTQLEVIQQPTTGYLTVTDGGSSQGTYNVTGNLTVTGSTRGGLIEVLLDNSAGHGLGVLRGNLTINSLSGTNEIYVDGTYGDASEIIKGNLLIDVGAGTNYIEIGTGAGITIRGSSNQIIGNSGFDYLQLGGGTATTVIGGALSVYGVQDITFVNVNILGGQLITMQMSPTNSALKLAPLNLTYILVNSTLTTNSSAITIIGSNLDDFIDMVGGDILGSTVIKEGAGNNLLDFNAQVNGNFTYTAGNGDNVVIIEAPTSILGLGNQRGDLTLTLGNGDNSYDLDTGFYVAHNFTLNNGNGDLNADIVASVGNYLTVDTGTGSNDVTLDTGTTFAQFFYSFAGSGVQNTLNVNNDGNQADIINVVIPAQPGTYLLDIVFQGNSPAGNPYPQEVNLSGGTNTPPQSTTTVVITTNGDAVTVNNSLQGTHTP